MFERPAVGAGPVDRTEQLVEQVAVAVLDVNEVEACVLGEDSCLDVRPDQPIEVVVREHDGCVGCDPSVEHRMVVGDQWLRRSLWS